LDTRVGTTAAVDHALRPTASVGLRGGQEIRLWSSIAAQDQLAP
jgi:hypothetical protein